LCYGDGIGQWLWLIQRVTSLGVLFFLVVHIIDTFLVVMYPAEYDVTVDIYGSVISSTRATRPPPTGSRSLTTPSSTRC
jgi:succinate dehydrogenase / fumarate reductase cytochrome b subunit